MALRRNKIGSQSYQDGRSEDFNLITTKKLKRIVLSFIGILTVAGGTTDGTLVQDGLLRTVLNVLRLEVNGRHTIDAQGQLFHWLLSVLTGSPGVLIEPAVTVGANACRFNVVVPLDQLRTAMRFMGRLNTDIQGSVKLHVENGQAEGGIVTGGDRTETLTGDMEIISEYDDKEWKGGYRQISKTRYSNAGATDQGRIVIPSGQLISGILLYAVDNSLLDDDIINRIKIQIGEDDIRRDVSWAALQEENVDDFGLELAAGAPPYTGIAYINFDKEGDMNPARILDTRGLAENVARITVDNNAPTGDSYLDVMFLGVVSKPKP